MLSSVSEGRCVGVQDGPVDAALVVSTEYAVGTRVVHRERGDRGTVRFAGMMPTPGRKTDVQMTLGVEWDAAVGRNDGHVGGIRYFDCPPSHGSFVVPSKVRAAENLESVLQRRYTTDFEAVQNKVTKMCRSRDPTYRDPDQGHAFVNVTNVDCSATPEMCAVCGTVPAQLSALFPNITHLSARSSLVESWAAVRDICSALRSLVTLNLNGCRLGSIPDEMKPTLRRQPLSVSVTSFSCGECQVTEQCVPWIIAAMPHAEELHVAGNGLRRFAFESAGITADGLQLRTPLKLLTLANNRFEDLREVAAGLGETLRQQLLSLNVSGCPLHTLEGIESFPHLERLTMRDVGLRQWDDLLPVHETATQLRHVCFSSPHLDGMLDTGDERRRHVVGLMPKHVTHVNLSFVRESEWRTARQSLMSDYVRRTKEGDLPHTAIPVLVKRLIDEQVDEGVQVFVPRPRLLELEIPVSLHLVLGPRAALRYLESEHFQHAIAGGGHMMGDPLANRDPAAASTAGGRTTSRSPRSAVQLSQPGASAATLEGFIVHIRRSVGDLRGAVSRFLVDSAADPEKRYIIESAVHLAVTGTLHLDDFFDVVRHQSSEESVRFFHLDSELMENSGAVARGMHVKAMAPDRAPCHNWRFQPGDGLVVTVEVPADQTNPHSHPSPS